MKSSSMTYFCAGFAVFAWGTMAPLSKVLLADFSDMEVLGYGSSLAALALLAIILGTGENERFQEYTGKDIMKLFCLGTIGYFMYSALYYKGLTILPSQTACILNYLWPIFTVIFSIIILKEKLSLKSIVAIVLSFLGVVVVVFRPGEQLIENVVEGSLLCIGAALCYGLFNVLNKKMGKSQLINMFVYLSCGAIGGLVGCYPYNFNVPQGSQWLGILWLGVIIDAGGYLLWAVAMQSGNTAQIANLAYATPIISILLSAVFLGEDIYLSSVIGIVMILGGFFYQHFKK